jgi:tripartite-type tricarboxylate transporter receptor subunit TctC
MTEAGVPGIGSLNWNGLFAPRKTPKAVIDRLHNVAVGIMSEPEMQDFMGKRAIPVAVSASPAEFDAYVRSERERWTKVVNDNNVKIE